MPALPIPLLESQVHSQKLCDKIKQKIIQNNNGWIDFAEFMHMALYMPRLGYYSGGARKFGKGGDFVTAPEITPLFAQTLARQAMQVLDGTAGDILELGAGTGNLAAEMLLELSSLECLPDRYFILEVSDYLRQIQKETLSAKLPVDLLRRVHWLDTVPTEFVGLMFANEVLDALPVHLVVKSNQDIFERGVMFDDGFGWLDIPLQDSELLKLTSVLEHSDNYLTEFCPAARALVKCLAASLKQGAILMIDYGFSSREYYHPQRNQGTLMCHYQHYAHSDPLINIGLQDITAHVDFTAIAEAGLAQDLMLQGYCSQAQFLINCGLLDLVALVSASNVVSYAPLAAAVQKLMSPAEMGELFKVIAFTKNMDDALLGFANGDKSHTL